MDAASRGSCRACVSDPAANRLFPGDYPVLDGKADEGLSSPRLPHARQVGTVMGKPLLVQAGAWILLFWDKIDKLLSKLEHAQFITEHVPWLARLMESARQMLESPDWFVSWVIPATGLLFICWLYWPAIKKRLRWPAVAPGLGLELLGMDCQKLSNEIAKYLAERALQEPKLPTLPDQMPEYAQHTLEHLRQTMNLYEIRYGPKVIDVVNRAAEAGLPISPNLRLVYRFPTNPIGVKVLGQELTILASEAFKKGGAN